MTAPVVSAVVVIAIVAVAAFCAGWLLARSRRGAADGPSPGDEARSEISFADALEHHPTGVVIGDRTGRIEYRNAAARRLTGTHHGVLVDEAIERHLELGRSGSAGERTLEFYGPPRMVFSISAEQLPDGRSVVFIEDISERRRVEQSRTDFVANISHELKTPVGAISVLAETLAESLGESLAGETDPDTIARVVERMLAESERAGRTIDDLIELSRIEAGVGRAAGPVRVADVIGAAVDRVAELARRSEITISTLAAVERDGPQPESLVVLGDRRQLVSAVGNLVENAVKYSEPGSLVQVRAKRDGDRVEISVADQGVGIPQRDLDRVFERFYRVDQARSRSTGGTGLGLSIVRHVAANHGGEVDVTSVEGEGSTFVLRLPIGDDAAQGAPPSSAATSEGVA